MREILFRGKDEQGQWQYGNLVRYTEDDGEQVTCIVSTARSEISAEVVFVPVDEKTVGPFTGFIDSKGARIYDGDIIQVNGRPYHQIKWLDEIGGFGTCNLVSKRELQRWPDRCLFNIPAQDWWKDFKREIVVVGNVYDNPDYLEKFVEPIKKED